MKKKILLILFLTFGGSYLLYHEIGGKLVKEEKRVEIFQKEVEDDFEYLDFEDSKIILNPYKKSSLSGVIPLKLEEDSKIEVKVFGKDEQSNIYLDYDFKKGNIIVPIHGLYLNTLNKVSLKLRGKEKTYQVYTSDIKYNFKLFDKNNDLRFTYDTFGPIKKYNEDEFISYGRLENDFGISFYKFNALGRISKEIIINDKIDIKRGFELNEDFIYFFDKDKRSLKVDVKTGKVSEGQKKKGENTSLKLIDYFRGKLNFEFERLNKLEKKCPEKRKFFLFKTLKLKENIKIVKEHDRLIIDNIFDDEVYVILDNFFNKKIYKSSDKKIYINDCVKGHFKIYLRVKDIVYETKRVVNFDAK